MGRTAWSDARVHQTGQTDAEWLYRKIQSQLPPGGARHVRGHKPGILTEIRPQHPSYMQDWWTPEAYDSALRDYRVKLERVQNFESVLVEVVSLMFTEKMQLAFQ